MTVAVGLVRAFTVRYLRGTDIGEQGLVTGEEKWYSISMMQSKESYIAARVLSTQCKDVDECFSQAHS